MQVDADADGDSGRDYLISLEVHALKEVCFVERCIDLLVNVHFTCVGIS